MKYQAYHTHAGNYIQHPNPHVYIHRHTYVCVVLSGNCCLLLRIALLAWCQTETASSAAPSAPTAHESMRQCGVSDCNASRWRQIFTNHSYLTHTQQQQQQQQKRQHTAFIGTSIFPELGSWRGGDLFTRDTRECMDAWGVHVVTIHLFILSRSHVNQTLFCTYNYLNMCVHIYKRVPVKTRSAFE